MFARYIVCDVIKPNSIVSDFSCYFQTSIPNFTEFYSEDVNKGMECIRLLNEIIGKVISHRSQLSVSI